MDMASLGAAARGVVEHLGQVQDILWAALVSAIVTLLLARMLVGQRPAALPEADEGACDFLLNGSALRPLTPAARGMLESIGNRHAALQTLTRHLERDCPRIQDDLEGLVLFGTSFRRHCQRPDGSAFEIAGSPRGGAALLSIRPASAEARALDEAERSLARAREETGFLRTALDRAPILVWSLAPDGVVTWANAAYRERFEQAESEIMLQRQACAFSHLLEEVPLTARSGCEKRSRVKVAARGDGDAYWFELSRIPLPSGETLCYAIEVDDLVAAEASLRRFVETLTETFAHLPIGLAVFDKNRRLGLFNPALSDLVKIDAVWLAGRPSLRDFLERLRETRQMPEQKDFAAFRRMLTTLEEAARDGTYEENWQLPSGKIFRVTGRPHPGGALAFLFEDITPAIHLERRYRGELELSQATLDRMAEAVAVFDTSGMLVFVNAAFERLWNLDPMARLDGPTVGELVALWEARCEETPVWDELRAFATGADSRTRWTSEIVMREGGRLALLVAPLPNGSTLVTFRRAGEAPEQAGSGAALAAALASGQALAELEAPVESALAALGQAAAAAPDPRVFTGLTQAAQTLKDALARARLRRSEAEAEAAADPAAPGAGLATLLALRGLRLAAMADGTDPVPVASGAFAPLLPALVMAAAALAPAGGVIEAGIERGEGRDALVLTLPGGVRPAETEPPLLALARRRIAEAGGRLEVEGHGARLRLVLLAEEERSPERLACAG
jgi:PAS domain-containing protein